MKKYVLALGVVGSFVLFSCNKCHECHYDDNGSEIEIGELCGEDLENAEANGYAINDSTTVTVHCEDH